MVETKPLLEIQDDESAVIADWYGIAYDLKHVISATKTLVNLLLQTERDNTLVRSLWSSALVAYVRCFKTGKRICLDPEIYAGLPGDPIGTHQYYKDTRDKHIAHPVNAFEEVRVGVLLDDLGAPVAIGHLAAFRLCDDEAGVAQLGRLASFSLEHIMKLIEPLENSMLTHAQENPSTLASLKSLRIQAKGGAETARAKRKLE